MLVNKKLYYIEAIRMMALENDVYITNDELKKMESKSVQQLEKEFDFYCNKQKVRW